MSVTDALRERLGDHAEGAIAALARWSTAPAFSPWHALLDAMVSQGRYDELADAFSQVLPFGTGGRRGPVGAGPNRFNPWTLGTSVEGHVRWLKARYPERALSVVVSYDVRRFDDVRGRYPDAPSPLDGMTSRTLAELAARIYAAHGVRVWIQRRDDRTYVSTPELSFLIRHLGAVAGLNVSASHNPPDDNGGKFYDEHGGQLVPPDDQTMLDEVVGIQTYTAIPWEQAEASFDWLTPAHHDAWVQAVVQGVPDVPRVPVAYTSLHGVGRVHDVLEAAGFPVRWITSQAAADGSFPTVPDAIANPERPEVFSHGLKQMEDEVLLLATDPDADRIGCMVRHGSGWRFLTGNQIAALVVDAVLSRWSSDLKPLVIRTEVTSELVSRVARGRGATVRDDLLVGFKYVADVMNHMPEGHRFAVGCEESHGLLVSESMRDKDAAGGALWLAIAASDAARSNKTLVDVLTGFDRSYGPVRNGQVSKAFEGVSGRSALASLMARLRKEVPKKLCGRAVEGCVDHRDPGGVHGPIRSETDNASRNVLAFRLGGKAGDGGARVIFRPSGTEPKLKVYVEVFASPGFDGAVLDGRIAELERDVAQLLSP